METMLANFVELPVPLQDAITALIVSAVVLLVHLLAVRVPLFKFLEAYAREWGLGIAAALLLWFQNAVPDQYAQVAIHAVELVLAILALVLGAIKFAARRGVQGFAQPQ